MFRDFLGNMECKTQCLNNLNNFLATKIVLTKQASGYLRSPDTLDTRLGERVSANVQPCCLGAQ